MQGVYSIPSRLTAGGERGSCRPWFSRDNYCSLVARLRRRSPDTYALHACKLCAPRTTLPLASRSIRSAHGRPDRRSAASTRFSTDFTGGFYHFHLPISDSLSGPRHRPVDVVEETNTAAFVSMAYAFFVCRQVR